MRGGKSWIKLYLNLGTALVIIINRAEARHTALKAVEIGGDEVGIFLIFLATLGIKKRLSLDTQLSLGASLGIIEQCGDIVSALMNMLKSVLLLKVGVQHIRQAWIGALVYVVTEIGDVHIGVIYRLAALIKHYGGGVALVN